MPTLDNTAEGGVEDTAVTTGNSGGASGNAFDVVSTGGSGAITFDNEHARGNRAFKVIGDTANACYLTYMSSLGTVAEAWGRLYLYMTASPGATTGIVRLRVAAAQVARITLDTGRHLQIRRADNNTLATMVAAVSLNQFVRVEWHCLATAAGGDIECRLYDAADSATITEQLSDTNAALANNLDEVNIGHHNASPATTFWLDDVQVNTTGWPGPAVTPNVPLLARQRPALPAMQRAASW